jgi:chromosome segregation ATPase
MDADTDDIRWLTYAELGQARGISTASATRLAFRRKWRRQVGNDGTARVAVPLAETQTRQDKAPDDRNDARDDISHVVMVLEASVASLSDRASAAEKRADRAEIRAESAEARANQAEQALSEERKRADQLELAQDRLETKLDEAEARADRADAAAQEAGQAADELRRANEARAGQGRWARLRQAWRGE